jgi:hypothetical protein
MLSALVCRRQSAWDRRDLTRQRTRLEAKGHRREHIPRTRRSAQRPRDRDRRIPLATQFPPNRLAPAFSATPARSLAKRDHPLAAAGMARWPQANRAPRGEKTKSVRPRCFLHYSLTTLRTNVPRAISTRECCARFNKFAIYSHSKQCRATARACPPRPPNSDSKALRR